MEENKECTCECAKKLKEENKKLKKIIKDLEEENKKLRQFIGVYEV